MFGPISTPTARIYGVGWLKKPIGRYLREPGPQAADKLAEVLGDDHDLFVFEELLEKLDAPQLARNGIARDIAKRRARLQRKALEHGRRLFGPGSRAFVRRVAHAG